ncbi:hypothetical protein HBB16_18500 [Pseudonocardia sp. MCCB 268]|nr:hypothetical protein [Pseudonocardia cytotoxica]
MHGALLCDPDRSQAAVTRGREEAAARATRRPGAALQTSTRPSPPTRSRAHGSALDRRAPVEARQAGRRSSPRSWSTVVLTREGRSLGMLHYRSSPNRSAAGTRPARAAARDPGHRGWSRTRTTPCSSRC